MIVRALLFNKILKTCRVRWSLGKTPTQLVSVHGGSCYMHGLSFYNGLV